MTAAECDLEQISVPQMRNSESDTSGSREVEPPAKDLKKEKSCPFSQLKGQSPGSSVCIKCYKSISA